MKYQWTDGQIGGHKLFIWCLKIEITGPTNPTDGCTGMPPYGHTSERVSARDSSKKASLSAMSIAPSRHKDLANSASPIVSTVAIVSVIAARIKLTTSAVLAGFGRAIIPMLAIRSGEAGAAVAHVIPRVPRVNVTFA